MSSTVSGTWVVCSACRAPIGFGATYWACSVSTCNREATRLYFCSVPCWDSHLATLRHRDAGAIEQRALLAGEAAAAPPPAARRVVASPLPSGSPAPSQSSSPGAPSPGALALAPATEDDILIVVSKMKKYIKERSGMNTSDAVAERLSDHVRALCDESIRTAARNERKTVLDRDVPAVRR